MTAGYLPSNKWQNEDSSPGDPVLEAMCPPTALHAFLEPLSGPRDEEK